MLQVKTCPLAVTAERLAHVSSFSCQAVPPCTTRLLSNVFPSRNAGAWWGWGLQDGNFGLKGPNTHFVRK